MTYHFSITTQKMAKARNSTLLANVCQVTCAWSAKHKNPLCLNVQQTIPVLSQKEASYADTQNSPNYSALPKGGQLCCVDTKQLGDLTAGSWPKHHFTWYSLSSAPYLVRETTSAQTSKKERLHSLLTIVAIHYTRQDNAVVIIADHVVNPGRSYSTAATTTTTNEGRGRA